MNNEFLNSSLAILWGTFTDILPILLVLGFFQIFVIRREIPYIKDICMGLVLVLIGLSIFILGLERCVFPVGAQMADQLAAPNFLTDGKIDVFEAGHKPAPSLYYWTYIFAFMIGFSTALAEPALIAVALKANEISTGAISQWGLRITVALGGAIGVTLGVYRIITGTPLYIYIACAYVFLLIQTYFAPKYIVPLAFDSGGVTTSTVTVPLLAALGIGLSSNIPGNSPILDGFGLIAFAALFPMMTTMAYAMISQYLIKRKQVEEIDSNE
ncbi:MAG: DUF1538 domain-containing protein [Nitrospinaceae bacterium]|jgi:hypothetical protein|nr:DUF1538 domain-containing protein [Nitrospinaceae bacterium]HAK37345.1 DUF1538 domain-containing protein [Nitrospina sp.]|tara:strand:- start:2077 stop:2886 length:810 start_codon:yes stop_codon:yes gene_type:complete